MTYAQLLFLEMTTEGQSSLSEQTQSGIHPRFFLLFIMRNRIESIYLQGAFITWSISSDNDYGTPCPGADCLRIPQIRKIIEQ